MYLNAMRSRGAVVNTSVVVSVANGVVAVKVIIFWLAMEGILKSQGTGLRTSWVKWGPLGSNGDHLGRMGFVKRQGTTKAKVIVEDVDAVK